MKLLVPKFSYLGKFLSSISYWELKRSFAARFFVLLFCLFLSFTFNTHAQVSYKINFSNQATPAPQGWLQDYGQPYGNRGNGLSYGWVSPQNENTTVDLTNRGRNRTPNPDKDIYRETFMHMRYGDVQPGSINGDWKMDLPNGTYRISVQVGDTDDELLLGTRHVIRAEGLNVIDFSVSPGVFGVRNGSRIIQVTDGTLNIDAIGSTNAKLHYVIIEPTSASQTPLVLSSSPLDGAANVALNAELRLNGLSLPNGVNLDPASVNTQNIQLFRITANGDVSVPISVALENAGSEVLITPNANLTNFSNYRIVVNGMKDLAGAEFLLFTSVFSTSDELITVGNNIFKINFSDQNTAPPSGWLLDYGLPFGNRGNNLFYGWVDPETKVPVNLSTRGRNRNPTPDVDVFRESFMHMRYNDINPSFINGDWAMNIQNGTYRITVQVGESDPETFEGTRHIIRAENIRLIDYPVSVDRYGVRNASAVVNVLDGQLNIDAFGSTNAKLHFVIIEPVNDLQTPTVLSSTPIDGAINVSPNSTISANFLLLPNPSNSGVTGTDNSSITTSTVKLFEVTANGAVSVPSFVNGTGGGDAINITPNNPLKENTRYRFVIDGVKDLAGVSMLPFTCEFETGESGSTQAGNLDQVSFIGGNTVASGESYTTLTIGPDGKLYGLSLFGEIHRWVIENDGSLSNREVISAWKNNYSPRTAVGLTFDPSSTSNNLIAYITHCSAGLQSAPAWDCKLSRVSGANLQNEQLLLTNLPRSLRDHLANSIAFKPGEDNILYFLMGSNSAGGAPDGAWGFRPERLLSGAVLALDLNKLNGLSLPLDVKTSNDINVINNAPAGSLTMSDGSYNPYATNSPLTLFATGIRNAYDLVWHSNGQLYVPANGTAGGSLSPASVNGSRRPDGSTYDHNSPNFPPVPAVGPNETQRDWLFRIDPSLGIGYYGHPNPLRGEFVMNRGKQDVGGYPAGTSADINYRGAAFDFEFNKSPNGVIEYKSSAHNGNLRGALLVVRYSNGDDIIALVPDGNSGNVNTFKIGIPGMTGFNNPLDLVEDPNTGNIYVADINSDSPELGKITLLRPVVGPGNSQRLTAITKEIVTADVVDGNPGQIFNIEVRNDGSQVINTLNANVIGEDNAAFQLVNTSVSNVNPGAIATFQIRFNAPKTGPQSASLVIQDPSGVNTALVPLKGLGIGSGKEPSLQWIADTYFGEGFINIGDDNPATDAIHTEQSFRIAPVLGDEIPINLFRKADPSQAVTFEVLGVFAPTEANPITAFGWYEEGKSNQLQEVGTIDNSNDRTLNVTTQGGTSFDPGNVSFGLYTRWPFFDNRLVFSEDDLNTFNPETNHHKRFYPIPNEPNAYLIAVEEFTRGYDFQDIVYIVRNVEPVDGAVIALENMTKIPGLSYGFPADDFYAFSNIDPLFVDYHQFKDKNTMRIANSGITPLVINQINISDLNFFTLPNNDVLPITIAPGAFYDLEIQFVDISGDKGIKTATIELVSNAQNLPNLTATLSGGHSDQPEGGNELSPQQVINTFGFLSNTNGLPDSAYPTPDEVTAGIHGDIVVSEYFEQADPNQPVVAFRLANYNARNSPTVKLIDAGGATVGGISFRTDPDWHNSILPLDLDGGKISSDFANSINVPFRISMAGYTTSGRNGTNPNTGLPNDLGVRVYKVIDRNGQVIPNHYIAIHDYVGNGCVATTGEASCDWNDNIAYFANIRPQALPTVSLIGDLILSPSESFSLNISDSFDAGYSGNALSFQAQLSNGDPLPSWLNFDAASGLFSGTAPSVQEATFTITVTATDINGIQVQGGFNIIIGDGSPLSCTASGELSYEIWNGISGTSIDNLTSSPDYPDNPSETLVLNNLFEGRTNFSSNYGSRISGVLCTPLTGNYTFWVSGDDNTELWLSSDENPANAQRIAFVPGWSNPREWTKFNEQQSAPINLIAGKKYYIFALQKEGGGGDNLAVGWQMPDNTLERPIPASYFSRPGQVIEPTLSLNPTSLNFESAVANADITVTSNTQWLASTDADWININPQNGNGDGAFQVSVSENTSQSARQADITVTAGSLSEIVTVNQAAAPVLENCTAEGTLRYEIWNGITGLNVSDLTTSANYPDNPNEVEVLTGLFEGRTNFANNYGSRISGILCAPQTGEYTFWVAGDDFTELWLSTDENPANAQLVAQVPGWSNPREWNKYPEQQSLPISLVQGQKYYIFALQKEGTGLDNLAVGWQLPDNTLERPVAASYFSQPATAECNWVLSANEGEQVVFTGTKTVRYGANGIYAFGTFTDGTPCNNAVFGDPTPGTVKQCWICETTNNPSLEIDNNLISAASAGSTESINVTANLAWTVLANQDWISLNPNQGTGNGSFDVIIAANNSGAVRNAVITVTGGSITRNITLSQEAAPVNNGDCFIENQGEVVMEAENYTRKQDGANRSWTLFSRNDASGGQAMEVNGSGANTDQNTNGPRMDYDIKFNTPGTYYVWALTAAQNGGGANNSVHLGLDQNCITCTGGNGVGRSNSSFTWIDDIEAGTNNITINIPAPGNYTFNVWMREDGVQIDKILLRQSTADPSGLGPNESSKGDCETTPPPPALEVNNAFFNAGFAGSTETVTVTSNVDWTLTSDQNWVTLNPDQGNGNGNFDLIIAANTDNTARNATVTVSGGGITRNISVSQEAAPILSNIIGEVGTLTLNVNWQTVNLNNTYNNPIVVAGALTFNGGEPAMARVRNVTSNSFEVRLEEWYCQDGNHANETLNYMVVEAGVHTLSNGKTLMAGNLASVGTGWIIQEFPEDFNEEPVIITQCVSVNDPLALITRIRQQETNAEQFQVKIQGAEGNSSHGAEQVAWIAAEAGVTVDNLPFEVVNYGRVSDERWKTITFSQTYVNPPVLVGELSTHHGGNPINLRYRNLTNTGFEHLGQEEQCNDDEVNHGTEELHAFIFNTVGNIEASPSDDIAARQSELNVKQNTELISERPEILLYPNPANTHDPIHLKLDGSARDWKRVVIYNAQGLLVQEIELNQIDQKEITLEGQNLNPGLYFLKIEVEGGVISKQVIIQSR